MTMKQVSEQEGSLIRPDQAAFVVDADGRFSLRFPQKSFDDLSDGHRLLLALAVRLNDPEWLEELLVGAGIKPQKKLGFL
jgi:hypothetical protein